MWGDHTSPIPSPPVPQRKPTKKEHNQQSFLAATIFPHLAVNLQFCLVLRTKRLVVAFVYPGHNDVTLGGSSKQVRGGVRGWGKG